MVVDTSALQAMYLGEAERLSFSVKLKASAQRHMSAVNFVEGSIIVAARFGATGLHAYDELIRRTQIGISLVDDEQARLARDAYLRFGKGHHPARLNLGDCFACALAKAMDQPLLFKGDDFARTDIAAA